MAVVLASLLAACGGGGGDNGGSGGSNGNGGGGGNGDGNPGSGPVTISGRAFYEFPPPRAGCQGLDFDAVQQRPIRQASVQVLDAATDAVLDAGVTTDTGEFELTVTGNTQVYIRVRAELKRTGNPGWDVEVRDNAFTGNGTLNLEERPLYALESAPFDSGSTDSSREVTARTGWDNSTASYTGKRAAAPFAVLDTAYAGMLLVLAEEPQAVFEPLDIFWSANNVPADGDGPGEIPTSFYSENRLFLLGDAGGDADEFDDHVVAHEWGHYFEDTFSRSDSIGGAHTPGDFLDMRVAFGEGFATALSGIVLADPQYCDTTRSSGFSINIEGSGGGTRGWFNEISVMEFIYDLWDIEDDSAGGDSGSIGFAPIYRVMTGPQAATPAFTSIFSFATALKEDDQVDSAFVDALLAAQGIRGEGITAFGVGEPNDGRDQPEDDPDVVPVYTEIIPGDPPRQICSNSQYDRASSAFTGNKLSEHRFLRMQLDEPARLTFDIRTINPPPDDPEDAHDHSDPDILILRNGVPQNRIVTPGENAQGFSPDANSEVFTVPEPLPAGEYAMALVEFRYRDAETPDTYPPRTCFNVAVTPVP